MQELCVEHCPPPGLGLTKFLVNFNCGLGRLLYCGLGRPLPKKTKKTKKSGGRAVGMTTGGVPLIRFFAPAAKVQNFLVTKTRDSPGPVLGAATLPFQKTFSLVSYKTPGFARARFGS